ncbi:MAG: hypothetical protein ACE5FF_03095 [Saprospiraceae bacterium]
MPFGFHLWDRGEMYFMLMDGSEVSISLPAVQLKMVLRFMNKLLPHASFGYSAERQRQFEMDPATLKSPVRDRGQRPAISSFNQNGLHFITPVKNCLNAVRLL